MISSMDDNANFVNSNNEWLKVVLLKVSMFVWRLQLNCSLTKDNFIKRRVIHNNDCLCIGGCNIAKDRDHLFVRCDVFGRLWSLVANWLSFEFVEHDLFF